MSWPALVLILKFKITSELENQNFKLVRLNPFHHFIMGTLTVLQNLLPRHELLKIIKSKLETRIGETVPT